MNLTVIANNSMEAAMRRQHEKAIAWQPVLLVDAGISGGIEQSRLVPLESKSSHSEAYRFASDVLKATPDAIGFTIKQKAL